MNRAAVTLWGCIGGDHFHELRFRSNTGWQELKVPVTDGERIRALYRMDDCSVGLVPRREQNRSLGLASCCWVRTESEKERERLWALAGRTEPTLILREGESVRRVAIWAVTRELDLLQVERANKRLAHAVGAKKKWADAEFMVHPPGTVLRLGREGRPLEVVAEHVSDVIWGPRKLFGGLQDPPPPKDWRQERAA